MQQTDTYSGPKWNYRPPVLLFSSLNPSSFDSLVRRREWIGCCPKNTNDRTKTNGRWCFTGPFCTTVWVIFRLVISLQILSFVFLWLNGASLSGKMMLELNFYCIIWSSHVWALFFAAQITSYFGLFSLFTTISSSSNLFCKRNFHSTTEHKMDSRKLRMISCILKCGNTSAWRLLRKKHKWTLFFLIVLKLLTLTNAVLRPEPF